MLIDESLPKLRTDKPYSSDICGNRDENIPRGNLGAQPLSSERWGDTLYIAEFKLDIFPSNISDS